MVEGSFEDLYKLTGEDFYASIEEQYGKNVVKILRYHDIDSYLVLGNIHEDEILNVFELPNDENSSNELISLKKEICTFTDGKVSLKIGTKGKVILLLQSAHVVVKKKKAQLLSEKKANQLDKFQSPSLANNCISEINIKEFYASIEQSLTKMLASINNKIHGIVIAEISSADFKIDVKCINDEVIPNCFVECICGDRIRLYYRRNNFQLSNLSKHVKSTYNKSKLKVNDQTREIDDSEFSNEIMIDDECSEQDDESSSRNDINNDNTLDSTSVTKKIK